MLAVAATYEEAWLRGPLMRFQEIVNRITGFSTPIFGVSRNPPIADVTVVRRVITFLEDRRVLYRPYEMEMPEYCIRSILEIRQFLTTELSSLAQESELSKSLKAMRAACRKFLDCSQSSDPRQIDVGRRPYTHLEGWTFYSGLGELRGVFGIHVGLIAVHYGADVEDQLAAILPGED